MKKSTQIIIKIIATSNSKKSSNSFSFLLNLVITASVLMLLPYLKHRLPRSEKEPPMDKLVNADENSHISDLAAQELMEAAEAKDVPRFKEALEILILNLFVWEGDQNDSDAI